jgi:Flp pilus assembly protein TadG
MALVALSIVAIVAMAGISIDIGTLYEASAEAQRSADAAALAAAKVLSSSGITGDPTNSSGQWSKACDAATAIAKAVANQDAVGGVATFTVNVTFLSSDASSCTSVGAFGVNPMVTVQVVQSTMPSYFARIWGRTGNRVSASATAEAFNPSGSAGLSGATIPVQPRCVKPLIVPNLDPGNATNKFVSTTAGATEGSIVNGGIRLSGGGTGVIGETFTLVPDCSPTGNCNSGPPFLNPPGATSSQLNYIPGQVSGTPVAVPSCAAGSFQKAIAGCDQSTVYQCGVLASSLGGNANQADLSEVSVPSNTSAAIQCLLNEAKGGTPDSIDTTVYPYQITAGSGNPLNISGSVITSSDSIVSIPIYDGSSLGGGSAPSVTIVGFLQVFIQSVDAVGDMTVTVMNVSGCGNAVPSGTTALNGTSPVPVRLITPP